MIKSGSLDFINHPKIITSVFLLSLLVFAYWFIVSHVISDIYKVAVVGAIAELLWLPMLGLLVLLPIVSIMQIIKNKHTQPLLPLFSLLTGIATILFLLLK